MTELEIENTIQSLIEVQGRWMAALPVTFLGQPMNLAIETFQGPIDDLLPLARSALKNIPSILELAEDEFRVYHEELDPEALAGATNPRVWISEDAFIEDGPNRWTIVVECEGRPDYGTHIEFDGSELLEIWSGD